MSARKAFLLRIDPRLWDALERWAADELRSVNGQIEYVLARAVREAGRERKAGPTTPPREGNANRPEPDKGPADSA
ncbi:MAG TPA: hypothetical protein VLT84_00665 [Acidobacteriota bacterium]|nr:hypothetical protein [Acidobacteriota bacterium]